MAVNNIPGKNVINIDGNEYDPSDFTDREKYYTTQIQDLQGKRQTAQFHSDQISGSLDYFTNLLIQSLSGKLANKSKEE